MGGAKFEFAGREEEQRTGQLKQEETRGNEQDFFSKQERRDDEQGFYRISDEDAEIPCETSLHESSALSFLCTEINAALLFSNLKEGQSYTSALSFDEG